MERTKIHVARNGFDLPGLQMDEIYFVSAANTKTLLKKPRCIKRIPGVGISLNFQKGNSVRGDIIDFSKASCGQPPGALFMEVWME